MATTMMTNNIAAAIAALGVGDGDDDSGSRYNRSYEPSSIITFLHGWPHYTKSFTKYDPHPKVVVDDPATWGETVQVIAIFLSLLSCIYLLVDFITRCYSCFFRSKHPITDKHYQRRRIAAYVMAGIALAASAVAAKISGDVTGSVHSVIHTIDDTLSYHNDIMDQATQLVTRLNTSDTLMMTILHTHQLPYSLEQRVHDTITRVREATNDTKLMVTQSPNMTTARDMMSSLTDVNKHRGWATAAILFAACLCMALLLGSAHFSRRKAKCYCPLQLFTILLFCVTWAAAALTIALSVGVGDVCMEPQAYTLEVVDHEASKYDLSIVKYYLYCFPEEINPLSEHVIAANHTLIHTRTLLAELDTYARDHQLSTLLPIIDHLKLNMNATDDELNELLSSLECWRVHNNYYDAVTTICHDFTSSFFVLAIFIACVSIFVALFRGCLPARKPPPPPEETLIHGMDDDEYDDYDHDTHEQGYEEERPNMAFTHATTTGGGNSGHVTSSPSSSLSRYVSASSPTHISVAKASPRIMPIAGSPINRSSSLRSTSGSSHAIFSNSPHDHAAYVYLPSVVNDDE